MITHRLSRLLSWVVTALVISLPATAATSVSQYGITWTFDKDYQVGQYANGDYWVLGPITITSISPASTSIEGRVANGSMINPSAGYFAPQGFDSAAPAFDASRNVGRPGGNDLTPSNPLIVPANSSLISSRSHAAASRPQLLDAAVLTVVASPPPAGSFRPPYQGTDKSHYWNKANLNYSILRQLPKVVNTPALSTVSSYFQRPWIEIQTETGGRYLHPSNNQPDYGRDIAYQLGSGLLSLHLDYSNAEKELLYIRLVQFGLDVYGALVNGGNWAPNGGHNQGRKMPMVLAGIALNDQRIKSNSSATAMFRFHEDRSTWKVTQADVGRVLYTADGRRREQYLQSDVGIAEWGEKHADQPDRDGRNWDAYYRDIFGSSVAAHALMAHLTGNAVELWNWAPFFDYMDRFYSVEKDRLDGANIIPSFHRQMWSAYRQLQGLTNTTVQPSNATISIQTN